MRCDVMWCFASSCRSKFR